MVLILDSLVPGHIAWFPFFSGMNMIHMLSEFDRSITNYQNHSLCLFCPNIMPIQQVSKRHGIDIPICCSFKLVANGESSFYKKSLNLYLDMI